MLQLLHALILTPILSCASPVAISTADTPPQEPGELSWYLPEATTYDDAFPTPQSMLGWEVGKWHVRHDQLVQWFQKVAHESPRMIVESYGQTYEQRPLLLATVSSPANLKRMDEIRQAHLQAVLSGDENYDGPAVVWMGYSVHGNEASGSNAALLLAYHLAAAQGDEIEEFLRNTVVLIDPCLNPDGLSRFAQWANMHRGQKLVGDPRHREHNEAWPGGRTNHYWFDLNRDWLLLTHPESQARLAKFHSWMPQVLTDFHEMGSDSTFFFQPGIPSRQNPLTPEGNLELTRKIATYHTAALDQIGSLYYTEESFDDFYYGKGSTYPDLNGSVGILFEQASARGHVQENSFGGITFPFAIRNQFTASLSTLRAVKEMRHELAAYQREFFRSAKLEAESHDVGAYVVASSGDETRLREFARILYQHQIQVNRLARDVSSASEEGKPFSKDDSLIIPLNQPQYRLIRALFETRTSWDDNTFYDVSSWTLPLAFNLPAQAIAKSSFDQNLIGKKWSAEQSTAKGLAQAESPVAWVFEWHDYSAPRALQILLEGGIRARVSTKPFRCITSEGERGFALGSIVIAAGTQDLKSDEVHALLEQAAEAGVQIHSASSGLTPDGVDLGSGSFRPLEAPNPLMLVGPGVSSYEAGEVWHLLDQRFELAVTMAEKRNFNRLDLARYTHIILVNGAASGFDEQQTSAIKDWVRNGGVLIGTKSSAMWAATRLLPTAPEKEEKKEKSEEEKEAENSSEQAPPPSYADYEDLRAVDQISGAIFETRLDLTHPMCFGFTRQNLPVFRNSNSILPMGTDPFAAPVRYTKNPLLSGYASEKSAAELATTPAVRAERLGSGSVICLVDNANFRGVWYGTNKLFANAIYFGKTLKRTGPIEGLNGQTSR